MQISDLQGQLADARSEENYSKCAMACRKLLYNALVFVFEKNGKAIPKSATMIELVDSEVLLEYFGEDNDDLIQALHYVRIVGMHAEHGDSISKKKAYIALENVAYLVSFIDNKEKGTAEPPKSKHMSERETRKQYIDVYLEEAGWN